MNTSVKLSLDKRHLLQNGSYPIILRLTHFRKTTSIRTGQEVPLEYWDDYKKKIKNTFSGAGSVAIANNILIKQLANAQEIINRLYDVGELTRLSVKEVKDRIIGKSKYQSFYGFGLLKVEELRAAQRLGTARSYEGVINVLKVLTKGKDLKFDELNFDFLKRFERYHLSKSGNSINGLASYLRTIKAIYNKGIKEGKIESEAYPFALYQIKTEPTEKRAIKLDYIKAILALDLEKDSTLYHYRNFFLLSYMMLGMSFIDMAFLKRENLVDGRIKFQRKKTSKRYDIKVTQQMYEILKIYSKGKKKNSFIFPIIKRSTLDLQYKDVQWALKRYNKGLKKIAELCSIEENLTSYVSRHSFATHAMLKNVPLPAISAMLGHSKLSTTQVYLKSLPSNILDAYQEELNSI